MDFYISSIFHILHLKQLVYHQQSHQYFAYRSLNILNNPFESQQGLVHHKHPRGVCQLEWFCSQDKKHSHLRLAVAILRNCLNCLAGSC